MKGFAFPEKFELGVASAATQIDGDCKNSSWYDWYQKGHIKDGANPDIATEHRKLMREDTALMAAMGIRHYRFGLEWARIEPSEGEFSEAEFEKVREEITLLQKSGVRVLLTIHHFSNPLWFEKKGAFLAKDTVQIFVRMVREVAKRLGDLVSEYITINEPNVYAFSGYAAGEFPPGRKSLLQTLKIMKILGECHRRSYEALHQEREKLGFSDTKVSFAHHMRAFAPWNAKNPFYRAVTSFSDKNFQGNISHDYLLGTSKDPGVYADFLAVNYYSRTASKGLHDATFPNVPVNDLGWEIYPQGIVQCCAALHKLLPELPIYITENGTADNHDAFRRRYLYEHIKALCESDLPVTRYYHWCYVDNFEWIDGFTARFGIVALDTQTMQRRIKSSGIFFQQMIAQHGISDEMAAAACAQEYPHG